jgi:predicted RNA-binding protein with PIN domain
MTLHNNTNSETAILLQLDQYVQHLQRYRRVYQQLIAECAAAEQSAPAQAESLKISAARFAAEVQRQRRRIARARNTLNKIRKTSGDPQ